MENLIHQVTRNVQLLLKLKIPQGRFSGKQWPEMVTEIGNYKTRIYHHILQWKFPKRGRLKCNIDGASNGNLGESSYGFCVRDHNGDIISAQANGIGIAINIEVEARAIQATLKVSKWQWW
ncbi:hypothetical protein RDI58_010815 [Solanum bulbocastanum]|uniref:RNase H type-1 domain-containing protein n=1 Tax=Solanum bulbocastanum TaxID=147425 RepID=A0AAN8TRM2_SOLBU